MRTRPPCKQPDGSDCPCRHVGCQSECSEYTKWQAIHQQERAAQWLYYAGANDAEAHLKDTKVKIGKRCQSKRRVGQP